MAKILVAGSLDLSEQSARDFATYLGEGVVKQGHVLLNGCLNEFDRMVAKGASDLLKEKGLEPCECIIGYVVAGREPAHKLGTILKSQLADWDLTHRGLYVPEQIHSADVVILVGGSRDTMRVANWARIDNKPLLPITAFGGAAEEVYEEELREFETKYAGRIDRLHYEMLNQVSSDWKKIVKDAVSLAERIISSKYAFVIMSFSRDPKLEDVYESFKEVCKELEYECSRVDDANAIDRIVPEIFANIMRSAFVIADLTEEKANVYYELGFAQGLNKPVVVTAYKGTSLPFDVKDIPTIFWENQKQLKDGLREKIGEIASLHGR